MRFGPFATLLILALAWSSSTCPSRASAAPATAPAAKMEPVRLSPDGAGFVLSPSGKSFVPWGMNYGNAGRLMEDFWETDWATFAGDLAELRAAGANAVRLHLQFAKFMDAADKPNEKSLALLGKTLALAEQTGIYLDLTGLACYRTEDVPAWYDALDEAGRWAAQSAFWDAVAKRCAASPAVFCYDLMNEPLAPGDKRKPKAWYSGTKLGPYDFLQYVSLDVGGRTRPEVARQWIKTLKTAIRKHDDHTLVTVGLLPWDPKWKFLSGFEPEEVAPEMDFVCVHIYPQAGTVPEAIEGLKKFAVGKPVVIEETFPLTCSADELRQFFVASKPIARGWVGHYDGQPIEELERLRREKKIGVSQGVYLSWLELFRDMTAEMTTETTGPRP